MKNNKGLSKILENIVELDGGLSIMKDGVAVDFTKEDLANLIKQSFEETRIDRDKVIQEKLIEFAEIMGINKDKYFDSEKSKMENIIENSKYSMGISILSRLVGVLDGLIKDQEKSQEEWLKN